MGNFFNSTAVGIHLRKTLQIYNSKFVRLTLTCISAEAVPLLYIINGTTLYIFMHNFAYIVCFEHSPDVKVFVFPLKIHIYI